MVLHLLGLPHTETTDIFSWCAYSQKTRRFASMLTAKGYDVRLYAAQTNHADCAEHISCITRDEQARLFGETIPTFDPDHPGFALFAQRAIVAIGERAQPGDMLCLTAGVAQEPIARAFPHLTIVEPGVGYGGVLNDSHRCFESYAWMHTVYGARSGGDAHSIDGRFYDTVIGNSYDPAEFPEGDGAGGYLLFVGRLIERKGLEIVRLVAERTGLPLVVAGSGDTRLIPPGAQYAGVVGPERRAELMGGAVALLCPTTYVGPFEGVNVEAQMCGTPVIATPWGAFTETVEDGSTGFLPHLLSDFVEAVNQAPTLDRAYIRRRALRLFSTAAAATKYDGWFQRIATLQHDGWYS